MIIPESQITRTDSGVRVQTEETQGDERFQRWSIYPANTQRAESADRIHREIL
jgi:hypothetical protein